MLGGCHAPGPIAPRGKSGSAPEKAQRNDRVGRQDAAVDLPELSDDVVRLRALHTDDVGTGAPGERSVVSQSRDPETTRWTTVPLAYNPELGGRFLADGARGWADGSTFTFAITDAGSDEFLGSLDLRADLMRTYRVGFGLGPWARGRGLMTRALRLALGWAFAADGLAAEQVTWEAFAGNWASRKAAWRVGFRGFATVRGLSEHRGVVTDGWIATLRPAELGHPEGRWLDVPTLPVTTRDGSAWVLRPWRGPDDEAEVAAALRAAGDAVTHRWLRHLPHPYTESDAREFLASRPEGPATGSTLSWTLGPASGGPGVLSLTAFGFDRPYGNPELGWWADPAARGRGLVSAALRRAVGWLLHEAPVGVRTHRLVAQIDAGNHASARVALAAGFTEFGRGHAEDPDPAGGWSDCRYFELLRADAGSGAVTGG